MKICLVGAGGIGSHLLPLLINISKDHEVFVMDGDRFETKNLDRQRFDSRLVGTNKADAMQEMYSSHGVQSVPFYLREWRQLSAYDWVICCPDNNAARLITIEAVSEGVTNAVISGNEARSANAMVWEGTFQWNPTMRYPDLLEPDEHGGISCHEEAVSVPQTALANSMAASMAMALFMYWTENAPQLPANILQEFAPLEYYWTPSAIITTKTGDINRDGSVQRPNR